MTRLILFFLILISFIFVKPIFAAGGISVTPFINHLDLAVDPPEYSITYKNMTKSEITLSFSAQDFSELEDGYRINFLQGKDDSNYKYGLSSWISFENKTLRLSPNEEKSVTIFIDKNRITKGGHYASILAEIQSPEENKQVAVKAIISSLLFVRASTGKEVEDGQILSLDPFRDGIEYPDTFLARFENSGNVFVTPFGVLEIYDPLGKLVAKGAFNQNSLDALPESIRTYKTTVNTYQKLLLPGFYKAKLSLDFGKTNQKLSSEITFFSQGSFDFVKLGLLIFGVVAILYFLKRRKN